MQGSQNHLRAFASQLARQGASYNTEFLTQTEFDQIASSSGQERGQKSVGRGGQGFGAQYQSGQGAAGPGVARQGGSGLSAGRQGGRGAGKGRGRQGRN